MKTTSMTLALLATLTTCGALAAQNTNQDAPKASHALEFADGTRIEVSYRQLTLAGGRNLKALMSKGAQGDATRQFYNQQYLPNFLGGSLVLAQPVNLGGHAVAAGSYGFTFRIDNDLVWHLVVSKGSDQVCDIALEPSRNRKAMADRLVVEPIASSDNDATGHLQIRYGPLLSRVSFGKPKAAGSGAEEAAAERAEKPKKADRGR